MVTSHPKLLTFMSFMNHKKETSPSCVYSIEMMKRNVATQVYYDDGSVLSAATTAIEYKGFYYLSPLVGEYILKVKAN